MMHQPPPLPPSTTTANTTTSAPGQNRLSSTNSPPVNATATASHASTLFNSPNQTSNLHNRYPSNTVIDIGSWPDLDSVLSDNASQPPPLINNTIPAHNSSVASKRDEIRSTTPPVPLNLMNDALDLEQLLTVQPFLTHDPAVAAKAPDTNKPYPSPYPATNSILPAQPPTQVQKTPSSLLTVPDIHATDTSQHVPPVSPSSATSDGSTQRKPRAMQQLVFGGRRFDLRSAMLTRGSTLIWVALPSVHKRKPAKLLDPGSLQVSDHRKSIVRRTRDSTLFKLSLLIVDTYQSAHPGFRYTQHLNPRRVLTKPSKPAKNDGFDNEDNDYILYVNDFVGDDTDRRYQIIDIMGQGTFGQVVKCLHIKSQRIFAVKVVKNKPAYFNQSLMEVNVLERLNTKFDAADTRHIIRLIDSFVYRRHLCLVFEPLSINLYELIKQNQFRGLDVGLVRTFTYQILDALTCLSEARLIHCDLKPENILLRGLHENQLKVIDFGSACHEHQTVYTYIQSRFYRSPEVLLGLPYTNAIDIWSLGCIVAELFLGLPLFPGTSEYNQVSRIVDMMGVPPNYMIEVGKNAKSYFHKVALESAGPNSPVLPTVYKLKSREQYSHEFSTNEQVSKRYFSGNSVREVIVQYPMSRKLNTHELDHQYKVRDCLVDFLHGVLCLNPIERWSAQQAKLHPFVTGSAWNGPWQPGNHAASSRTGTSSFHQSVPTSISSDSIHTLHQNTPTNLPVAVPLTAAISPSLLPNNPTPLSPTGSANSLNSLTQPSVRRQRSRTMSSANSFSSSHLNSSPSPYVPMVSGQAMAAAAHRHQQRKSSIADLSASLHDRVRRGSLIENLGVAANAAALAAASPLKNAQALSLLAGSQQGEPLKTLSQQQQPGAAPFIHHQSTSALFTTGNPTGSHQEVPKLRKGRSQSITATSIPSSFHITAAAAAAGWGTSPYYEPAAVGTSHQPASTGTSTTKIYPPAYSSGAPVPASQSASGIGVPTWNPSYRIIPSHLELVPSSSVYDDEWRDDLPISGILSLDVLPSPALTSGAGPGALSGHVATSQQVPDSITTASSLATPNPVISSGD